MEKAIVVYSHIVGLAVIRALGKMDVPIVSLYYLPSEMGYLSKYVKERIKVPDPAKEENDYLSKLIDLAKKHNGSLLIPTDDYTVVTLSKNKQLLESFYIVGVEDWKIVKKLIQKQHTYEFASSLGIPCPNTFVPKSFEELKMYCQELTYPCLIKPCEGHRFFDHFKVKMFKIENEEQLLSNYIQVERLGLKVMIQEIIPGDASQGINYNSYVVNGEPVAEFTARKVRIEPPFFGSPRVLKSEVIPDIIEPGRLLLKKLNYTGFSCTEFKKDTRDGIYKLMEVNCRSNLTGSLAVDCGINFPWIMYRHLVYGEINHQTYFKPDVYWIDITKDFMRFFISRKREGYSLKEYLKPYLSKKIFAIMSITDPLPFLNRCIYLATIIIKKAVKIINRRFYRKVKLPDQRSGLLKSPKT